MHQFPVVCLVSLAFLTSPVSADLVRIATMGDSLTDEYAGFSYSSDGDRSWVELLRTYRPAEFAIDNFARAGAKTFELITQGQTSAVAQRLKSNQGYFGTLIVGANDLTTANLVPIITGDLEPIRQAIPVQIEAILDAMDGIPPRSLIVFNLPDFRLNPLFGPILESLPTLKPIAENALNTLNNEIRQSVLAHDQILVDFFSLTNLAANGSFPLAGVQVTDFFAPDNIHLNNIGQGAVANLVIEAIEQNSSLNLTPFSDQEILALRRLTSPISTPHYLDLSRFIITAIPETNLLAPATFVASAAFMFLARRRRFLSL